jgi:hypothetical protein
MSWAAVSAAVDIGVQDEGKWKATWLHEAKIAQATNSHRTLITALQKRQS